MNSESVINLAKLGLSGDRVALLDYLKFLAADSANKNKISLYRGLTDVIEHQERSTIMTSGLGPARVHEDLWFNRSLQRRIDKVINLFEDESVPKELRAKFNKILLYGPPGTGKTTIGFHIAKRLNRSIEYVKVSDVISFKFGETLKNIANIFEDESKSIIFIDEFDAFAKSRFDSNDVGELKRVVNSLIQTLDVLSKDKIVIVATNIVETIDPAILRRFPFKLQVPELSKGDIGDYIEFILKNNVKDKIILDQEDLQILQSILQVSGLKTIDAITNVFDATLINIHIRKVKVGSLSDIIEAAIADGMLTADKIRKIQDSNPNLFKKMMKYLKTNVSQSEAAELLGLHRNSLTNYAKKI